MVFLEVLCKGQHQVLDILNQDSILVLREEVDQGLEVLDVVDRSEDLDCSIFDFFILILEVFPDCLPNLFVSRVPL